MSTSDAGPVDGPGVDLSTALLRTHRYVRLGLVALVVLLAVAVVIETVRHGRQGSISAYYYTPAHSVLVGTLCGIGVLLVVYRGMSDLEDVILNGAGFLAFVVAFVPSERDAVTCLPTQSFCDVPSSTVVDNVLALIVVGGLALGTAYVMFVKPMTGAARRAFWTIVVGYLALVVFFFGFRDAFLARGHYVAAVALFAGMLAVVRLNWQHLRSARPPAPAGLVAWYRWSFWVLVAGAVVLGVASWSGALRGGAFWVESWLIVGFAGFWLTQTRGQCWNDPRYLAGAAPRTDVT